MSELRNAAVVVKDEPGLKYKVAESLVPLLEDITILGQHPENPRANDPQRLADSLEDHGAFRSIVVNRGSFTQRTGPNTILAGNHTYQGACLLEWTHIPVTWVDVDDDEADEILLIDNKLGDDAWNDEAAQRKILERLPESRRHRAGWGRDAMEALLAQGKKNDQDHGDDYDPKLDEEPEPPDPPISRRGDVWLLGRHRLMCGDTTNPEDVEKLVGDRMVDLLVTSPPYGVGKEYESGEIDDWRDLMKGWTQAWKPYTDTVMVNIADIRVGPDQREVHTYGEIIYFCRQAGWPLIGTRIWTKQPVWQIAPYWINSYRAVDDWEYLGLFGHAEHVKDRVSATDEWRYRGTWAIPSVNRNDDHVAKFPVELPRRYIKLLTDPGGLVADPMAGSGTTILAAQISGRNALGMEIREDYADVACKRFQNATGIDPVLERTGEVYNFLDEEDF